MLLVLFKYVYAGNPLTLLGSCVCALDVSVFAYNVQHKYVIYQFIAILPSYQHVLLSIIYGLSIECCLFILFIVPSVFH